MYKLVTIQESVRVPPKFLGDEETSKSIRKALQDEMEGTLDKDLGVVLCVTDVRDIGEGKIIPGDGSVYFETTFDALVFKPELHEVIEGEVIDVVEFGAFVRLGPLDGLVHVSQLADDFMSLSKGGVLATKSEGRDIKIKDNVIARIVAVSLKQNIPSKIGLTMRQPGLGKLEWYEVDVAPSAETKTAVKKQAVGKKK